MGCLFVANEYKCVFALVLGLFSNVFVTPEHFDDLKNDGLVCSHQKNVFSNIKRLRFHTYLPVSEKESLD